MLYSKQDSQNSKCDLYGKILSVLIALHITISLTVIGVRFFSDKNETKKKGEIEEVKNKYKKPIAWEQNEYDNWYNI
jgi:hypothetical protein